MARERFNFWLDLDKEDEFVLADKIFELKQERLFSKTVRDGISLIVDLREGRLDVLFELFPWVRAEFMEYVESVESDEIQAWLMRMEQLIVGVGVGSVELDRDH